jgi:small subunit ribosomal protein S2
VIPGNDDAIRSANLMSRIVADAVEEGRFLAQRKGIVPPTIAPEGARPAPPLLDPEQQQRARDEAAAAQRQRETRLAQSRAAATDGGTGGEPGEGEPAPAGDAVAPTPDQPAAEATPDA